MSHRIFSKQKEKVHPLIVLYTKLLYGNFTRTDENEKQQSVTSSVSEARRKVSRC